MKKYLYVFNYPPHEEELCKLEFKYLFNDEFKSKYYLTNQDININTSIFIKAKIDIFMISNDFTDLLQLVNNSKLYYLNFKVIYFKNDNTHVDYQESLQKCKDLSWGIDGSVNMAKPENTLALTKIDNQWIFGYYHHGIPSWKKHDDKPYTFSNSLDIRLARTLVNLASKNNPNTKIIDPCCGVGTVVLEGLGLGLNICGSDISREISWQARLNLKHYGYNEELIKKISIHEIYDYFDVAIMDIPYNLYTPITYEEQCALINSSRKICQELIIVTFDEMSLEINNAGFKIINHCTLKKANFERHIYIAR